MASTSSSAGLDGFPVVLSIGILAWNEEDVIGTTIQSVFRQSLFAEFNRRGLGCEIICVANGCTDRTAAVAAGVLASGGVPDTARTVVRSRVESLVKRGKINAWNTFVHTLSARGARCLILMDGDIVLHHPDTLWNLYATLMNQPEAWVATGQAIKDIALKPTRRLHERISLATSAMTRTGEAQLTGQLYAIKADMARNLYLPRFLLVEDGFIKAVVCTDFLTRPPSPERLVRAPDASHVFEAYLSPAVILKNQKRQMIGQTITHLLVDDYLKNLGVSERKQLGATLKARDENDPLWLKRLIDNHLRHTRFFWQLFPGLLAFRFRRLAKLSPGRRITHFPAAVAGTIVSLLAGWLAYRSLKRGDTNYWPDTKSRNLQWLQSPRPVEPAAESLA